MPSRWFKLEETDRALQSYPPFFHHGQLARTLQDSACKPHTTPLLSRQSMTWTDLWSAIAAQTQLSPLDQSLTASEGKEIFVRGSDRGQNCRCELVGRLRRQKRPLLGRGPSGTYLAFSRGISPTFPEVPAGAPTTMERQKGGEQVWVCAGGPWQVCWWSSSWAWPPRPPRRPA